MSTTAQILPPGFRFADLLGLQVTLLALLVTFKLAVPLPPPPVTHLPTALCDLQRESCRLTLPGNLAVDLKTPDRPIDPSRPFTLEASVNSDRIRLLQLDILGIDVAMSGISIRFTNSEAGQFRAQASFPLCTVQRMTWQMNVLLTVDGEHLNWPLRFQTESAG